MEVLECLESEKHQRDKVAELLKLKHSLQQQVTQAKTREVLTFSILNQYSIEDVSVLIPCHKMVRYKVLIAGSSCVHPSVICKSICTSVLYDSFCSVSDISL